MIPNVTEEHACHVNELVAVEFEFINAEAKAVFVAGSFNGWSAQASPLTRGYGGRWTRAAMLAPGNYQYCLVIDGRWVLDPMNQASVENGYGGRNSVLTVEESMEGAHVIDAEHERFEIAEKTGSVGG